MPPSNWNNCLNSDIWLENRSQAEYGCHTPRFCGSLREEACIHCSQRKPASLEELCFSVILKNAELLKRADYTLCHLPHRIYWLIGRALNAGLISEAWQLVPFVSEYGETQPSWFGADQSICLSRFQIYCEVSQKLKPYMTCTSAGIDKILRYLSNVGSSFKDFWSEMTSAMKTLKVEIRSENVEPLNSVMCAEENKVVLMKAMELTDNEHWPRRKEFDSMKELQRLSKTFSCPVVFKPTKIELREVESDEIPCLLDDIDPEVISDVEIRKRAWSVADIDELGRVLSACNNLSDLYLWQQYAPAEVQEGVVPAIWRLLSQHHQLRKFGLVDFHLAGTLASYPLPLVETLRLRACTFAEEDWNFMANRSDLALKSLLVSSVFYGHHIPSLCVFIQSQAKSLEHLLLEYRILTIKEICELLRIMAKFNKLEVFELKCMELIDFVSMKKVIVDLMSFQSTRQFVIRVPTRINSDARQLQAVINDLEEVVKELCKINRRPPINLKLNIF